MQAKMQLIKQEDMISRGLMGCLRMAEAKIKEMKNNRRICIVFILMELGQILI